MPSLSRRAVLGFSLAALPSLARAQTKAEPYKIGGTVPLTGPLASAIAEIIAAVQIAVADVNRAGGVKGRPLELDLEDTQGNPQGGVAAYRKLVQVDGVKLIWTVYTNVVTAQIPLADQLKVPFLTQVEVPGLLLKSQYGFNHASNGGLTVPVLREYWRARKVKRLFAFLGNNAFGQGYSGILKPAALAIGAEYAEAFIDLGDTDFRGVVARAKDFNPDAVLATAQGGAAETTVLRQVRELGISAPMFTPTNNFNQKSWRDGIGPYAEGMTFAGLNVDERANPTFVGEYRARQGYPPGYQAAEGYDILKMLAFALERAGDDSDGIRSVLAGLKNFPSVLGGSVSMGEDHYTQISAIALWQVSGGKLVRLPAPR